MNFTYKNHLKYFIGSNLYSKRTDSLQPYIVKVGKIDGEYYQKSSYRNELLRTADLVYKDLGKDFALFLSGGTDSEIVARNFIDIGIKPICFIIKLVNNFNIGDVNYSIEFCKSFDLKYYVIDFDVIDFYKRGEANEFSQDIACTQITYLMIYFNILRLQLPSVMGGELLLKRNVNLDNSFWYYCFRENEDASAIRFSLKYNIPLVNEWFSYTPELMLYYLTNNSIKNLVSEKLNYKLSSTSSKNRILKDLLPEIYLRPKTHGFESLLAFNLEAYKNLGIDHVKRLVNSIDGIEYNKVLKDLVYGDN